MNCGILLNADQGCFFSYVQWLLKQQIKSNYFDISGIYTNKQKKVKKIFDNIKYFDSLDQVLTSSDIVFSFGYWQIIEKESILKVPRGIINFHHSYKLKYKGRDCSTWALRHDEPIHGSTMHFIDEDLDKGEIIDTRFFNIAPDHTAEDIFFKANNLGLQMLKDNLYSVLSGKKNENPILESEKSFKFRKKDLSHEITNKHIKDEKGLVRDIRALTFDQKNAPYIVLEKQKVYLKLKNYDDGILKKRKNDI